MRSAGLMLLIAGLVAGLAVGQTADEKKGTIAYLQGLQTREGGFRPADKAPRPTLRGTSAALRALRYFDGKAADLETCKKFVLACRDPKTGGFADTPGGKPDVILTAVGLMALVELKLPTEKIEPGAIAFLEKNARSFEEVRMAAAGLQTLGKASEKNAEWIATLTKNQNRTGTFGKGKALARDTGGAVACLLRLGGKVAKPAALIAALDAEQRADGGFGKDSTDTSDLETSYRVVRTYHMLKAKPAGADAMRAFIARCRNSDGGYGVTPGETSSAGGTYFASILLHWLDAR